MSFLQSFRLVTARPHKAAMPFLAISGIVALICRVPRFRIFRAISLLATLFFGFCCYFFRNPTRIPPDEEGVLVAAADGRVLSTKLMVPHANLQLGHAPRWRISIFLSVLDVHINRMPASGKVEHVLYIPGKFFNASMEKASKYNERNTVILKLDKGGNIAVTQIAGFLARRIVCTAKKGEHFGTGEAFGLIRFGSRTDIYLPIGIKPLVKPLQTMVGGETIIARLSDNAME